MSCCLDSYESCMPVLCRTRYVRRQLWLTYKLLQLPLKNKQILVEKLLVLERVLLGFSLRHDLRRRLSTIDSS